ncbi:MAG: NAD(P)-dependent glycerol-3-phosphate dehydrogenase [Candidatus Rokuibacteriota bacterium]|nr:MAG: NAD(P)-dependent glycerol-3-phosphate dehydrogenase [Candidatus Rokubacteria bacterium]
MITIVGAGSWGTALAVHLARAGAGVRLCARSAEVVEAIRARRRNPWYLPDVELPSAVEVTGDAAAAAAAATLVIVAVPSEFFAGAVGRLGALTAPVLSATKGFEPARHRRMSEVAAERWPGVPVAVLSGPTFAREVARGQPTAAVVASRDDGLAAELQRRLGSREFRLYTNRDVIGVEVGGALKNVIALATGMADGLGLGENARAALVTRGLAEITRLAVALGGEPATLAGLAGLGDLVLTSTGTLSRNRALGMALARGESREAAQQATRMVAEGVPTVRSALALAARHGVTLPIATEIAAVLFEGKSPAEGLRSLLGRAATREDVRVGERDA